MLKCSERHCQQIAVRAQFSRSGGGGEKVCQRQRGLAYSNSQRSSKVSDLVIYRKKRRGRLSSCVHGGTQFSQKWEITADLVHGLFVCGGTRSQRWQLLPLHPQGKPTAEKQSRVQTRPSVHPRTGGFCWQTPPSPPLRTRFAPNSHTPAGKLSRVPAELPDLICKCEGNPLKTTGPWSMFE